MKLRATALDPEGDLIQRKWFATPEEAVNDLFAQDCGGELPPRLAQELRPARIHVHCLDLDSWTDGDAGDDGA